MSLTEKGLCASVPGKAVLTQPICESQTYYNRLPLSQRGCTCQIIEITTHSVEMEMHGSAL